MPTDPLTAAMLGDTGADPAVQAAYRALREAITKATPPITRDQLSKLYQQRRYTEIEELRQSGQLNHILNEEPQP